MSKRLPTREQGDSSITFSEFRFPEFKHERPADTIRRIGHATKSIHFTHTPAKAIVEKISQRIASLPRVSIEVNLGEDSTIDDMDRLVPVIRLTKRLTISGWRSPSLHVLEHANPRLYSLRLGPFRAKRSLEILKRFTQLRYAHLEGTFRDIVSIGQVRSLKGLCLRSFRVKDFTFLRGLDNLQGLWIGLGSANSLEGVQSLPSVRYLELWNIRQLRDLGPLAESTSLEEVLLQDFKKPIRVPSLEALTNLRKVVLYCTPAIKTLGPVASAPNLESLIVDANFVHQLSWIPLRKYHVLRNHPSLQELYVRGADTGDLQRSVGPRITLKSDSSSLRKLIGPDY